MNLQAFKKLKIKIENRSFEKDYSIVDKTLYCSSFFGNFLSVVLAYFFLKDIVRDATISFAGQAVIIPTVIILFLALFELLKRFTFGSLILNVLTSKYLLNARTFLGSAFILVLIGGTFYLTLSGAKVYVDKEEQITLNTDSIVQANSDSLNRKFDVEVKKVEDRILYVYEAAQTRKRKSLTIDEIKNIKLWEQDIKSLKIEKNKEIEQLKKEITKGSQYQLDKTNKNQWAFILLSAFVELLILIGVGFRSFYTFTIYGEFKDKFEADPKYFRYETYLELLTVLYGKGKTGVGTVLPSYNRLRELASSQRFYSQKDVRDFLSLCSHLKITSTGGSIRRSEKTFDQAQQILKDYLGIE